MKDVAVIGAGIAGMATAARLQAQGLSTIVFEAHGQPGGCAGFYRRKGFSFDVGATTLVDFEPGGVGGELLEHIGMPTVDGEALPGYLAWLPDRVVTLHRASLAWASERQKMLGDTPAHLAFWEFLDRLAQIFWQASRNGVKLPVQNIHDLLHGIRALGPEHILQARYMYWTMNDALRAFNLRDDLPLVGLLSMLIEDTVHNTIDQAPLINAALGITIRGAGLLRARGGMRGFWQKFTGHYRAIGGDLRVGCKVEHIDGQKGDFRIKTRRGTFQAGQVISALPAASSAKIAPSLCAKPLQPYLERDAHSMGGAVVVFLGVPEAQVEGQLFTHHQLLQEYGKPLGDGNNMFISVSAPGDTASAPAGFRTVMISTHSALEQWESLTLHEYQDLKRSVAERLVSFARRVYPELGQQAVVYEVGTPLTYQRFNLRPRGAVGGIHQALHNANQHAIPHNSGVAGFWLVGDTTWPGLGTVACILGSRIVAEQVIHSARTQHLFVPSFAKGGRSHARAYSH